MGWDKAEEANTKLWDFLTLTCTDDALVVVESAKESGFEAWRLLHKRYAPSGGRHELHRMAALLTRKQCASLSQVPRAVDELEADFRKYNDTTGYTFPEEWKLPLLLQMLPASHKSELEMKFTMGERDYNTMVKNIVRFRMTTGGARPKRKTPTPWTLTTSNL